MVLTRFTADLARALPIGPRLQVVPEIVREGKKLQLVQLRIVVDDVEHAWASAFMPSLGWIDFDPTNAVFPGERHVTVAWGRDFSDVSPLRGIVLGGGQHSLSVAVDVTPED